MTSFSTQASVNIAGGLVLWPRGLTLNAYRLIISGGVIGRALLVSLGITGAGTVWSRSSSSTRSCRSTSPRGCC